MGNHFLKPYTVVYQTPCALHHPRNSVSEARCSPCPSICPRHFFTPRDNQNRSLSTVAKLPVRCSKPPRANFSSGSPRQVDQPRRRTEKRGQTGHLRLGSLWGCTLFCLAVQAQVIARVRVSRCKFDVPRLPPSRLPMPCRSTRLPDRDVPSSTGNS